MIQANEGSKIIAPVDPVRTGYIFEGWYLESSFVNLWDFDDDVVTSDITLYAKWSEAGPTDQDKVDDAYEWLSIGDLTALTQSSPRLILPTERNGVTIAWSIDKLQYIAANGVITQPTFETGNQTVTLTATLTLNAATSTKVFTATVIALPSVENTPPLINETFKSYTAGNILSQSGIWGPVSGKTGNSLFTVVTSILGTTIPKSSHALKIEALKELQIEAPIVHAYNLLIIEVDLMQSSSSDASAINIQSSASSPVVAFGLDGASLYYRVDNGTLVKKSITVNQWYTLRVEINIANKTIEAFYYENGQLISLTPGPVTYVGTTTLQSLFIRSGSSTTEVLRNPAYITNLVANRIEALPRPVPIIKLGEVTGIQSTVSVAQNAVFTPDVPVVKNYYGSNQLLVKDTDYTLAVTNPVNTAVPGNYVVSYVFTNLSTPTDIKTVTQDVTVYAVGEPNEITGVTSTIAMYPDRKSSIVVTVLQPEGDLYYHLSNNATETIQTIKTGVKVSVTSQTVNLVDVVVGEYDYIHFYVELNGDSNVFSHPISAQVLTEINTPQAFYNAVQTNSSTHYFLLTADIDMTGFVWIEPIELNKLTSIFDGAGHTVSNLTLSKTVKGGIFADIENGTIKNVIFDNIQTTTTTGTSALLVGESRGQSVIQNVVIMNSSHVGNADYAALIVGRVRAGSLKVSNLSVIDSNVESKKDYAGGIVAGMDLSTSIILEDIYLSGFTLLEATSDTGQMAGILIGRIQGNVEIKRVIAVDIFVKGIKNIGGLIGKSDEPGTTVTLTDIYLNGSVERLDLGSNNYGSIVANIADQIPTLSNVWVTGFAEVGNLSLDVAPEFKVAFSSIQNSAWWQTNIPSILSTDLWEFAVSGTPVLKFALVNMKPLHDVTLDYNIVDMPNEVIQVREGQPFSYGAPLVIGYNFMGWFSDAAMTQAIEELIITVPVTIYGKYVAIPTYDVTFESNGGSVVPAILDVLENEVITKPTDPTKEGYTFEGWFKDALFAVAWDFAVDTVTADITLYAKWEEIPAVTYTVSFESNGGSAVAALLLVPEQTLITAPTPPTKDGYTFEGWFKDVELLDDWVFSTDQVNANITLYAKWALVPITYTVTFESNGGSAVTQITGVAEGATIAAPTAPTRSGFDFSGWYEDIALLDAWVFESDLVNANITLYAKWTEKLPTPISTAQAFYDMSISGSTEKFVLANNIDFTGFAWVQTGTGTSFGGTLDGAGYTISNITITSTGTGTYGGIFQKVNGAVIKNLIINNANVNTSGRTGIIVGRAENNQSTFENIEIHNSYVQGADTSGNGTGLLIGNANVLVNVDNVIITNSTGYSTQKNIGFIIGQTVQSINISNINILDSSLQSTNADSTSGVGGLIGYTNTNALTASIQKVVMKSVTLTGRGVGTLIGYMRFGSLIASDIMTDVTFSYPGVGTPQQGAIGNKAGTALTHSFERVFAHYVGQQAGSAIQLPSENVLANLDGLNQAWWETNLPNIHGNSAWAYDAVSKFYELN